MIAGTRDGALSLCKGSLIKTVDEYSAVSFIDVGRMCYRLGVKMYLSCAY